MTYNFPGDRPLSPFAIKTDGLTKQYGDILAVDGLSLEVPGGHTFGLLGPNGSGKTTTMAMLLGLVKPTAGSFQLFDPGTGHQEALGRIGAIVETPSFYPYLSGRNNLTYFQGISGRGNPGEVDELLNLVGLAGRGDDRFREYSLGMKQRLGLAYALLGDPEILFLDEPTNGMDPAGMAEVREMIRGLGTGGRTVLLSSHLLHEVEQVCDSVAILSKGKLIAQGEVSQLLNMEGSGRLRLRTTNNIRAIGLLSDLSWTGEVSADGESVVVEAPSERSGEISSTLAGHQVYITEMTVEQRSLEQYFLEVTGSDEGESE